MEGNIIWKNENGNGFLGMRGNGIKKSFPLLPLLETNELPALSQYGYSYEFIRIGPCHSRPSEWRQACGFIIIDFCRTFDKIGTNILCQN